MSQDLDQVATKAQNTQGIGDRVEKWRQNSCNKILASVKSKGFYPWCLAHFCQTLDVGFGQIYPLQNGQDNMFCTYLTSVVAWLANHTLKWSRRRLRININTTYIFTKKKKLGKYYSRNPLCTEGGGIFTACMNLHRDINTTFPCNTLIIWVFSHVCDFQFYSWLRSRSWHFYVGFVCNNIHTLDGVETINPNYYF